MNKDSKKQNTKQLGIPSSFQKSILWKAITGISIAIIVCLIVSSVIILGKFLNILQPVLVPVAIAAILSYLLSPLVHWIRKKAPLKKYNLTRTRAIALIYTILIITSAILALSIFIPASKQLSDLVENRTTIIEKAQEKISKFSSFFSLPTINVMT